MKRRLTAVFSLLLVLIFVMSTIPAFGETVSLAYKNGSLRLRKGPGTGYGTAGFLSDGDSITVVSKGSVWSKVRTSGGTTGYIKNLYISGIGGNYADGTSYFSGNYEGVVTTKYSGSTVNLRSGASTSTSSIGKLASGTKVKVLGENGNWYLVETKSGTQGYMSKTYIKTAAAEAEIYATVTGRGVNLRTGAGTGYTVLTSLAKGTKVQVLEKTNANWWKVSYGFYVGYMSTSYLSAR